MGRAKTTQPDPIEPRDLSEVIPARVSARVKHLVRLRARRAGVSPSIWVRWIIYEALGLNKE